MCGVFAACSFEERIEESDVWRALSALRSRGPDGEAVSGNQSRTTYLAHARLSINDPEFGAQPLFSEDGKVSVVVNGEIYNHRELRNELELKGHNFRTRSDSEVVVHLYEEYGAGLFSRLRGEFAILLSDEREGVLLAARDEFGIKPLVYTRCSSRILIASQAKAILAYGHEAQWNYDSISAISCFSYQPVTKSLFKGIEILPPGFLLRVQDRDVKVQPYKKERSPCVDAYDLDLAVQECRAILEESVRLRVDTELGFACCLSGGIDSWAVYRLAQIASGRSPDCFTVSFVGSEYDELPIIEDNLKNYGSRLHVIEVDDARLLSALPEAVVSAEGLAINGHLPAKYLMFEQVRAAGFKIALTGEGADEMFLGYPHFKQDIMADGDARLVGVNLSYEDLIKENRLNAHLMMADKTVSKEDALLPAFLRAKYRAWSHFRKVLASQTSSFFETINGLGYREDLLRGNLPKSLSSSLDMWNQVALAGYILRVLGDGTEMAHGIEGRPPFLDSKVRRFATSLPANFLFKDGREKYVLRQAMQGLVPEVILSRRKHPFFAPPVSLFKGSSLTGIAYDLLLAAPPEFIDRRSLDGLLDEYQSSSERQSYDGVIWQLLSLGALKAGYGLP